MQGNMVKLDNEYRYGRVSKSVETSRESKVTILWNQQVRTDRTVPENKPDIKIFDNIRGMCMLGDVAILGDRNVVKKEGEKILKCKDLKTEFQHMWNVKAKVIPLVTGTTGTILKSLRQYLSNITGKREIKELQTTVVLGTARIMRVSADVKVQNIFYGQNNITCSANCK